MANLHVSYEDVRGAAGRLIAGREDIDARLHELKAIVDQLVTEGYVTTASSGAFHDHYSQFTASASQTVASLDGLGGFLRSAADALQQADESLAASLRR